MPSMYNIFQLNVGIKPWTEVEALALALDHHTTLAGKVHQLHSSVKDAAVSLLDTRHQLGHTDDTNDVISILYTAR